MEAVPSSAATGAGASGGAGASQASYAHALGGGLHSADLHLLQHQPQPHEQYLAPSGGPYGGGGGGVGSAAGAALQPSADSQMQPSLSSSAANTQRTDDKSVADGEAPAYLFQCKADSTARLVDLLETLMLDKDQKAAVQVLPAGLRVSVDKGKSMAAKAYIKTQTFADFELTQKEVGFHIPLHVLIQCLSVFGGGGPREPLSSRDKKGGAAAAGGGGGHWGHDHSRVPPNNTHMTMTYPAPGHPLQLMLEEDNVVTQCALNTFDESAASSRTELNFRSSQIIARAVVKSAFLRDAFLELDAPSATMVTIRISPQHPQFTMTVDGNLGQCKVEFPPTSAAEIFTEFECKTTIQNVYPLALLRACKPALLRSESTNMRFNEGGMLSLQHVIASDGTTQNWVEYLIVPQEIGAGGLAAMEDDEKVKAELKQQQQRK